MASTIEYGPGLKPTIRHLMILVLFVALVSFPLANDWDQLKPRSFNDKAFIALFLVFAACLVLPVLILVLDRRSPARSWYALVVFWSFMMIGLTGGGWFLSGSGTIPRLWYLKLLRYALPLMFVACSIR
jgi:hypothetical protein